MCYERTGKMTYKRGSVEIGGATLNYVAEGEGPALLVLGSSIYYPRTFSKGLRRSCTLICIDLPHFCASQRAVRPRQHQFRFLLRVHRRRPDGCGS